MAFPNFPRNLAHFDCSEARRAHKFTSCALGFSGKYSFHTVCKKYAPKLAARYLWETVQRDLPSLRAVIAHELDCDSITSIPPAKFTPGIRFGNGLGR